MEAPTEKLSYMNIKGWFDFHALYSKIANDLPDGSCVVEVGVYHGRSLAFYIEAMKLAGKSHRVYAVDTWKNNYHNFLSSMFSLGINHLVTPIRADSVIASHGFADESVDFCFIDADHRYEFVKNDILAWLPKVKPSRILAGHDLDAPQCRGVRKAVEEVIGRENFEKWGRSWVYYKK